MKSSGVVLQSQGVFESAENLNIRAWLDPEQGLIYRPRDPPSGSSLKQAKEGRGQAELQTEARYETEGTVMKFSVTHDPSDQHADTEVGKQAFEQQLD